MRNLRTSVGLILILLFGDSPSFCQTPFWQLTSLDSGSVWTFATNGHGDVFAGVWNTAWHATRRLYRSTNDGNTWDTLAIGVPNPVVWCIVTVPNNGVYIGLTVGTDTVLGGVYYSPGNGDTWERRWSTYGVHALITPDSGRTFMAGKYGGESLWPGGVYRSVDSCRTWTRLNPDTCYDYSLVTNLAFTRQGSILAALGGSSCLPPNNGRYGLIRSTDNGATWTRHFTWLGRGYINDFLIPPEGDIFLAARWEGVNRSSSDGQGWSNSSNGIPPNSAYYMASMGMDSAGTLYAGEDWGNGVFRSTDNGQNWSQFGLAGYVNRFIVNVRGYLFAGTADGVYRSVRPVGAVLSTNRTQIIFPQIPVGTSVTDSFTVYSQNSVPLVITSATSTDLAFTVSPDSITIAPRDSAYFYVTFSPDSVRQYSGAIVLEYNGRLSPLTITVQGDAVTGIGEDNNLPKEFSLIQNYPNPFNPVTIIRYQLPVGSFVSLKVYNLVGQEVATLVEEKQEAGYRAVEFNAAKLSTGVYFYRLQAGEFVTTKKLLLLK